MRDFIYRGFHDRPREVVVIGESGSLLLSSPFDDGADEYREEYEAFWLPADIDLSGSWQSLREHATESLGRVSVMAVEFDPTFRRQLNLESLGEVLARIADRFA